jgi:hypothetical protein
MHVRLQRRRAFKPLVRDANRSPARSPLVHYTAYPEQPRLYPNQSDGPAQSLANYPPKRDKSTTPRPGSAAPAFQLKQERYRAKRSDDLSYPSHDTCD